MDALEEFQNAYYHLHQTLMILALAPNEQCTRQGNYNTAWELKNDMTSKGWWVLNQKLSDRLTPAQKQGLLQLINRLEVVPVDALPAGAVFEDNLVAMKHSAWQPIRTAAKELLLLLRPIAVANERYFEHRASAPFALSTSDVALYLKHILQGALGRHDWQRFIDTPLPGSPSMDAVRLHCLRIEQFGGTGAGDTISLTVGARTEIQELLRELKPSSNYSSSGREEA